MTSPGLAEFRRIISSAQAERNSIDADLHIAKRDSVMADASYASWYYGWFLKRIRPKRFAELEMLAADFRARVEELVEQRRLTTVTTEIAIAEEHAAFFGRLCDAFAALARAARIWDTVATQKTDQFRQRTRATQALDRNPVRFGFDQLDILTSEWEVPRLRNVNGGDMFLYPGFLIYHISRDAFSTIDFGDLEIQCELSQFIEDEVVPRDTEVIGQTWLKTNKDGSPDRRFRENRQIPVCRYARLSLRSSGGLNEEYLVSDFAVAENFCRELKTFVRFLDP